MRRRTVRPRGAGLTNAGLPGLAPALERDPRRGLSRLGELLAFAAEHLAQHDPQAALAWCRRAVGALDDPSAPRPTHRDRDKVWHSLAGALLAAGATDELRARLEEAPVQAALGRGLALMRARLAHLEGDDARARALADLYLETDPDDAVARRWRDGLAR